MGVQATERTTERDRELGDLLYAADHLRQELLDLLNCPAVPGSRTLWEQHCDLVEADLRAVEEQLLQKEQKRGAGGRK